MQGNLGTFDLNALLEDRSFHSKTAYGWDYQALASQRKSNAIAPSKIPELAQAPQQRTIFKDLPRKQLTEPPKQRLAELQYPRPRPEEEKKS